MKSSFNGNYQITLTGQSHEPYFTIEVNHIPSNIKIDLNIINQELNKRKPRTTFNTKRIEHNNYEIISGLIKNDDYYLTDGNIIKIKFINNNIKVKDYDLIKEFDRPGHVDYVGRKKYQDHQLNGGGHFSGRLTTGLVFIGALIKQVILTKINDFNVITHISKCLEIIDDNYYSINNKEIIKEYENNYYLNDILMFNKDKYKKLLNKIKDIDYNFGGQLETIIINVPSLLGDTWFNSLEAKIAQFIYAIPAIKGIVFGDYLNFNEKDNYEQIIGYQEDKLITKNNYNGGINGGISNGEDIVFTTILKPIATLNKEIQSYNYKQKKMAPLLIKGRHDQSIINRIIPIINACTVLAIYDELIKEKYFQ
jgi:chorismate synthase